MSEWTSIEASVVLCVRNGATSIRRQLDALDAQVGAPDFEVVVVDNGSTDGTREIVRAWQTEAGHAARAIVLLDAGDPPGLPRSRNLGAASARGRVVLACDADDEVGPNWAAAMMRALDGDQLAGGRLLAVDSRGNSRTDLFGPGLIATPYLPHVGGANFAVSRRVFFAVGGFDESLPPYGFDDVDFSWRVQEAGFPIIYVDDAEVRFTVSDAGASVRKRFLLGKGRVLMAQRYPRYDSTRYTARLVLGDVVRSAMDLVRRSATSRRIDRRAAGRVIAATGRIAGYLAYVVLGRAPTPALMREKPEP